MCRLESLEELSGERIWQEFLKALKAPEPCRWFETLSDFLPTNHGLESLAELLKLRPEVR